MKSERWLSLFFGLALVALGAFSLLANTLLRTGAWRLWPLVVVISGITLMVPGFFGFKRRGFGAFFIPGFPLLTTGGILLVASLLGWWGIWALLWPLEVIALALGFAFAAVFMRVAGLAIPALVVGFNGLILAFCNLTGLWGAWAVLWPLELLAAGLGLLVVGYAYRSTGAKTAGLILTGIASAGALVTSFISFFNSTFLRFTAPALLVLCGLILIGAQWFRPAGGVGTDNHLMAEETV
jgi:hypothetical protein